MTLVVRRPARRRAEFVGVFVVESSEYVGNVCQVPMGLPCWFVVTNPLDEVFDSSVPSSRIEDILDFVFFFVVDNHWRVVWLLLALEWVVAGRFEE